MTTPNEPDPVEPTDGAGVMPDDPPQDGVDQTSAYEGDDA
jgi:hypothetical protein